ncbi:MAG: response regulator [Gammaproteobacteria bacterium]|nr:response regulator [Gammaproteobacteria bacterium]
MKLHLHTRLLISLLALLLVGFSLLGMILFTDAQKQISQHHQTQAIYQAKTLADSSLDGLVSEDYEVLEKLVRTAMPSSEYAYAALVRSNGKILTHTNLILIGETASTVNSDGFGITREATYNGRPVLEIIYPAQINDQTLANAHVAYYLDVEYSLQNDTITRLFFVLLITLALILVATHFVTRSITVPIEKLSNCISNTSLEQGLNIDPSITEREDEIGELAHSFQDVSNDLISSHKELATSLLSNKAIVDTASDGILVIDDKGTIQSINIAGEKIFGYSTAELVGNNINLLIPEQHRDSHNDYLKSFTGTSISSLVESRIEVSGVRKDGSRLPLEIAIGKISMEDKNLYTSTIRDISSRYEYEHALVLAKAAAEDGNRIKSEFLANISHELRTPMNAVLGYLDLLSMDELPQPQNKYVTTATRSAEELLEIINNILEFTRMENHETELDTSQFSMREIVKSLINEFSDRYKNKDIVLSSKIGNDLPDQLIGDPSRIRNIIHHFMVNAFKFTKQGKIAVNIDVLQQRQSSVEISVEVRDTGIGIEPVNRNRIFDLFTQADGSSTRRYGGTGIGLALCKKMVLSMSGEIGVDSEPDVGSTFWFSLELEISKALAQTNIPTQTTDTKTSEDMAQYTHGRKILVVEDNPFNQDLMLAMLNVMDYEAEVVGNGKLALEALAEKHYDLILMDCQMPVMNGFEATEHIRQTEKQHTPIIAVTAHAMDGDRELCIKSGMDDYMTKPFSKGDLEHIIQKWLK